MTGNPAGELREAAQGMREQHGPDHPRHEFWYALADWLDVVAGQAEQSGNWALHSLSPGPLKVARTYLGTLEVPGD